MEKTTKTVLIAAVALIAVIFAVMMVWKSVGPGSQSGGVANTASDVMAKSSSTENAMSPEAQKEVISKGVSGPRKGTGPANHGP